jgi:hypothetical protein
MRLNTKRWVVVSVVALGFFLGWLLTSFGLGSNLIIRSQIFSLNDGTKQNAVREFYAQDKPDYVFAGTIAMVNSRDGGGVWVWSNQGLKYFKADQHTSYSYYDVCVAMSSSQEGEKKIDSNMRETTMDIKEWAEWINVGDFVQLIIATPDQGGQEGNLREIYAYGLPLFLPMKIGVMCAS